MRKSPPRLKRIGISCGEPSGQALVQELYPQLRQMWPEATIEGVGGPSDGFFQSWSELEPLAVHGFLPILRHLPFFWKWKKRWLRWLNQDPTHTLLILIDYPGLNQSLARHAQKMGLCVVWIAPPQVWIWKQKRVEHLRDLPLATLFEFEHQALAQMGVASQWVGHPLTQISPVSQYGQKVLLFAGSRPCRFAHQAPAFACAAQQILELDPNLEPLWVLPAQIPSSAFAVPNSWGIVSAQDPNLWEGARAALCFPGTITLELALRRIPMICLAAPSPWTRILAQKILSRGPVSLPNWILAKSWIPEILWPNPLALQAAWQSLWTETGTLHPDLFLDHQVLQQKMAPRPDFANHTLLWLQEIWHKHHG